MAVAILLQSESGRWNIVRKWKLKYWKKVNFGCTAVAMDARWQLKYCSFDIPPPIPPSGCRYRDIYGAGGKIFTKGEIHCKCWLVTKDKTTLSKDEKGKEIKLGLMKATSSLKYKHWRDAKENLWSYSQARHQVQLPNILSLCKLISRVCANSLRRPGCPSHPGSDGSPHPRLTSTSTTSTSSTSPAKRMNLFSFSFSISCCQIIR